MLRIFVEKHGADVLAQDRKEPMRRSILLDMLALPNGTKIGSQVLIWEEPRWRMWRAYLLTACLRYRLSQMRNVDASFS